MSNTVRYHGDRILRNRIKNLEEHDQRKINKSIKKFKHRYLPGGLITFTERGKFATKAKAKGSFHDNHSSHSFDNGLSFK